MLDPTAPDRPTAPETGVEDRVREIVAEYWLDAESDNEDRALERLARALAATEAAAERDRLAAAASPAEPEPVEPTCICFLGPSVAQGCPVHHPGYYAAPEPLPGVDAEEAWEALADAVTSEVGGAATSVMREIQAHAIVTRHRPAIEAAVLRAARRSPE